VFTLAFTLEDASRSKAVAPAIVTSPVETSLSISPPTSRLFFVSFGL